MSTSEHPQTSDVRLFLQEYVHPPSPSHVPWPSRPPRGPSANLVMTVNNGTTRLRSRRLHTAVGGHLVVERDDSVLIELRDFIYGELRPNINFSAVERADLDAQLRVGRLSVDEFDSLHDHQNLRDYYNLGLFRVVNQIGKYKGIFKNNEASGVFKADPDGTNGAPDWICNDGVIELKADTGEVKSDHAKRFFREHLSANGTRRTYPLSDGAVGQLSNGPIIHGTILDLLEQLIREMHSRGKRWAVVLLYDIGFVVKLHQKNEMKISSIIYRDTPSQDDLTFINTIPNITLTLVLTAIARQPRSDPTSALYVARSVWMVSSSGNPGSFSPSTAAQQSHVVSSVSMLTSPSTGGAWIPGSFPSLGSDGLGSQGEYSDESDRWHVPVEEYKPDIAIGETFRLYLPQELHRQLFISHDRSMGHILSPSLLQKLSLQRVLPHVPTRKLRGRSPTIHHAASHTSYSRPRRISHSDDDDTSNSSLSSDESVPLLSFGVLELELGQAIGSGSTWDVYTSPTAPGYVIKVCCPQGVLERYAKRSRDDVLTVTVHDIVQEVLRDTIIPMALSSNSTKHLPRTYGLWSGTVPMDDGDETWSLFVAIQEDVRQGGKFQSLESWDQLTLQQRCAVADWLDSVMKQGFTHGDIEPRHCFIARGFTDWKIIDWGRGTIKEQVSEEEWDDESGQDGIELDILRQPRHGDADVVAIL